MIDYFERRHPVDYEMFLKYVRVGIDSSVAQLERGAKHYGRLLEDELTTVLVDLLLARELDAAHDADYSGHLDVSIRSKCGRFMWGAEAKIAYSYEWLAQGVDQLFDSYIDGTTGRDKGGLLIYLKRENATGVMNEWRARLKELWSGTDPTFADADCPERPGYAFITTQNLRRTGMPYELRHIGVSLWRQHSIELAIEAEERELAKKLQTELMERERALKAERVKQAAERKKVAAAASIP